MWLLSIRLWTFMPWVQARRGGAEEAVRGTVSGCRSYHQDLGQYSKSPSSCADTQLGSSATTGIEGIVGLVVYVGVGPEERGVGDPQTLGAGSPGFVRLWSLRGFRISFDKHQSQVAEWRPRGTLGQFTRVVGSCDG